jgi:hypothetical protein
VVDAAVSETPTPGNGGASGRAEDPLHVRTDNVPFALIIRLFLISWALAVLIPLGIVLALRWYDQDKQIKEIQKVAATNRILVRKNGALQRQVRAFVSQQCIEAESRDVVNVQTNNAMILLLNEVAPPSPEQPPETRKQIDMFIQSLRDANATLEPEGERDCQPGPEGGSP